MIIIILRLVHLLLFLSVAHLLGNDNLLKSNYNIGKNDFLLEDCQRADLINPEKCRQIPITVYYPTNNTKKSKLKYIKNEAIIHKLIEIGYLRQEADDLKNLSKFDIEVGENVQIAKASFPLILFSHGLGIGSFNYSFLLKELASKGYIVVAIDHPYGGFVQLQNGAFLHTQQDKKLNQPTNEMYIHLIQEWSKDQQVVLNAILTPISTVGKKISASIVPHQIFTLGHSLGGNTAIYTLTFDQRIKGAINMDGGISDEKNILSSQKNILVLRSQPDYSDEELRAKGRNLEEWEKMGKEIDLSFSNAMQKAPNAYELKIKGAGHLSFSDTPFVLPKTITQFGGNIIDEDVCFQLIFGAIETFIQQTIHHKNIDFTTFKSYKELSIKKY